MNGGNIDYYLDANQHRLVSMLAANLRFGAASLRDMSQLDQINRFCDGLEAEFRNEVSYRRCSALSQPLSELRRTNWMFIWFAY
ncbi:uncharacterized protein PITG_12190 [Phytophthora infestans T30-4]|uniref:Uncharacterized protein n=1 Tax=Phytophthora infestans (strain T30-4) TaxID=403677 RepID=D0NJ96_PHYIT|nr:uncharacterized protein PITG_12190 [Phytophthora infestans T30-4]EEY59614.1 hypothetical protein PITG_12190 [Phytophthora infestans T30-4]|eukprot:XP_002900807.1 hypothetical protein PITG_12190 [Phytophthora infestans T30-4]